MSLHIKLMAERKLRHHIVLTYPEIIQNAQRISRWKINQRVFLFTSTEILMNLSFDEGGSLEDGY